jgi:acetyl-CoA C-acetyltransferase
LAGIAPGDVDVAEVHDCTVGAELVATAALGFCSEGELDRFACSGRNTYGGDVVVGPSGGMLARGHAPGATGLAQVAELTRQLRGTAGARQVDGARTALQHNGGPGSTLVVTVLQAA